MTAIDPAWQTFRSRLLAQPDLRDLVATLNACRGSLPSADDDLVREAFERMAGDEWLAPCRDKDVPVGQALRHVDQLLNAATVALVRYSDACGSARPMPYERELFFLLDFCVRTGAAGLTLFGGTRANDLHHAEQAAQKIDQFRLSSCSLLAALVSICAREGVFTNAPRSALLRTISRELSAYLGALSVAQLTKLCGTAGTQSDGTSDAKAWARIAELCERKLGLGCPGTSTAQAPVPGL